MKIVGPLLLLTMIAMSPDSLNAQNDPPKAKAEIIFIHGNFYTGVPGSSGFGEMQRVSALAVREGRILATGKRLRDD